jgi:hypothetical protein
MPNTNPVYKAKWHQHVEAKPVMENIVAATCENEGTSDSVVYCSECGKELYREQGTTPPLDHDWDEGVITVAPTCTANGVKTFTCKNDRAHKRAEAVDSLGHDWGAWKALDANQHQQVCAHDASHVQIADHSWDSGKVTKAATCRATGVKTFTCTVCKTTKTETLPKKEHNYKTVQRLYINQI